MNRVANSHQEFPGVPHNPPLGANTAKPVLKQTSNTCTWSLIKDLEIISLNCCKTRDHGHLLRGPKVLFLIVFTFIKQSI